MSYSYYIKEALGIEDFISPLVRAEPIVAKPRTLFSVTVPSMSLVTAEKDLMVNILKALKQEFSDVDVLVEGEPASSTLNIHFLGQSVGETKEHDSGDRIDFYTYNLRDIVARPVLKKQVWDHLKTALNHL